LLGSGIGALQVIKGDRLTFGLSCAEAIALVAHNAIVGLTRAVADGTFYETSFVHFSPSVAVGVRARIAVAYSLAVAALAS
jgi:hypothetical protein